LTSKILFIVWTFLNLSCVQVRTENFYLPINFEGNVAIIYKTNGLEQTSQQDWNIPNDGILKTDFKFIPGRLITNYLQRNNHNSYDTLSSDFIVKDTTKIQIVFHRVLTFVKPNSKEEIYVTTFYVGKKKVEDLERDRFLFERKIEKMLFPKSE
jgi:hypothetical protein